MTENSYFLLPGPTAVPQRILRAGSMGMMNHRGPEFATLLADVTAKSQKVFQTKNDIIILTCSGSGGLEASVVNFINPGDKVIVASIGNFGNRYRDICQQFGANVDFIPFPWGEAIDPAIIKAHLDADVNKEIKAVFFQHNETSTGVTNDVEAIAKACAGHPALVIVDSVSGMAAAPLKTDEWGLDVVVAGSQKAFMSPPGIAMVSVSDRAWAQAETAKGPKYYLDLVSARGFAKKGQTPYTPAISTIYAINEALDMMFEMGLDNIIDEHYYRRDLILAATAALGLKPVADISCASPAVTAIYTPAGISTSDIVKPLREKFNTIVAGGQGQLDGKSFRIGHLGYVKELDLIGCIAALEMVLFELGQPITLGSGVAAAQKVILARKNK